jgi:pyrroline-5-carboxylate reductase
MIKLAIIGAGAMGSAIARGLVKASCYQPFEIILFDLNSSTLKQLAQEGFKVSSDIQAIAAPIVLFAVKPQNINEVLESLAKLDPACLLISILAGTKIQKFAGFFPSNPIVRAMPNTPAQLARGVTALAFNAKSSKQNKLEAKKLFEAIGKVVEVEEQEMDLVTAVSGSGPAYVYLLEEVMIKAAIEFGMNQDTAQILVRQTIVGAAALLEANPETKAEELRAKVSSPNGTTHAAVTSLIDSGFEQILRNAIAAAKTRSEELGV